ncbi:MAG: CDGSH iron-sulfur domain-containing protein [SAR324 cluster bacterium]|nr:CDGSH iron-sulfur domain-containing protein [SAR324 cluster bacterium]
MSETKLSKAKISIVKNGPIKVTGLKNFSNSRGEKIKTKQSMILCRCGASKKKPFCDGKHISLGFEDEKSEERVSDQLDEYQGESITILDNRGICSHAGVCTSQLPEVWGGVNWINPDGAGKEKIISIINKCPSGALSFRINGKNNSENQGEPGIRVSRNGQLEVQGGIELENIRQGKGASQDHYALCRCGQSKNKPFCDGSHWYAGFKDNEDLTISASNREELSEEENWRTVGKTEDLEIGCVKQIQIGPKQIVLARTDSGFFALDAQCPHQGGPLGEGEICEGNKIRCPWHGYLFALKSGRGVGNDDAVKTFELREQDGILEILVPKAKRSSWTVSHLMAETLVEWGVDTVFGMVGHSNLGLAEAIRIQEKKGKMKYFGVRHEGAAAFACSGYAKIKGNPAACLAIAGPGATNLLTGLWDAKMDRAPVLALTGQVNSQVLGPGAFQEIDTSSAFQAVAQFSQTVMADSNHTELASLACKNAIVSRDVSHLIFPDEIQVQEAGDLGPGRPDGRVSGTEITPPTQALNSSVYRLAAAKKPLIIAGYGARQSIKEVVALAEKLNSPIITTFKAKGFISDHHELGGGVLGKSGTPVASTLMSEADLLIVFGSSFSKHTGIATRKPIIQVDYDRMALGKFHPVDEMVWGDVGITAQLMKDQIPEKINCHDQRDYLKKLWKSWRTEKKKRSAEEHQQGISSALIFQELSDEIPENAVISVDVGNNAYSFGRYFECKERQEVIMSGYLGSIGFGFPAGMGAWAAVEGLRKVVVVAGDGGFGQYLAEFTTAVKYKMAITVILLHNRELGKISKEQRDGEWDVWQTSLSNPNFAKFAKLCGGDGITVSRPADLRSAFEIGMKSTMPFIVEIMSDALLT